MSVIAAGYCFEDLAVGMSASLSKTVTVADIEMFATAVGDFNPIHMDEEWAKQTRFGGRIAHGMLTGGIVSSVLGTRLPGPGNVYIKQTLEFRAPVRPGATVEAEVRITKLEPERNRVHLDTTCTCDGVVVLTGEAILFVQSRDRRL
ncbi:MaoC family dehydratase [Devosia sp. A449]